MASNAVGQSERATPWWVWAIVIAIAAIEPVTHHILAAIDSDTAVFSGVHTADSSICLVAMRMGESNFHSPYATWRSAAGAHSPRHFAHPYHWIYGGLGVLSGWLGASDFLVMGWAHGASAALFLWTMRSFFRTVTPRAASPAFLLYSLGGGLGGVAYLVCRATGLDESHLFEERFLRFAMYDLLEGPAVAPFLLAPRLYYTASLACCFGALTLAIGDGPHSRRRGVASGLLFFVGTVVNARAGVFVLAVRIAHGLFARNGSMRRGGYLEVGCFAGCAVYGAVAFLNPYFAAHYVEHTGQSLWPTAFLSAAFFVLPLASIPLVAEWRGFSRPAQRVLGATGGYLVTFATLFLGHQIYWGNLLVASGEAHAAMVVSDWALLGIPLGLFAVRKRTVERENPSSDDGWIAVWCCVALAAAVSAFGQGWFLQFTPQRLVVVVAPALALLAGSGFQRLAKASPPFAYGMFGVAIASGIVSTIVASLFIQAPLGLRPGEGAFASWHHEVITPADDELLASIAGGTVLTAWPLSDVVALRRPAQVLGGVASNDLSDQGAAEMRPLVESFFSTEMDDGQRRAFVEDWRVDYVFCTDTWPVRAAVLAELLRAPWLETVATSGKGIVFRVIRAP